MSERKGYVDTEYLRLLAEMVGHYKERTYEVMQVRQGSILLDVGCGPGTDTIALVRLVGPVGRVFGVDFDADMVAEANRRAGEAGVSAQVEHRQADATSLPFEDNTFDACRAERLFQHLVEPDRVLDEMVRVTRSGGRVVVLDTDYASISIDTEEVDIERRLGRVFTEHLHYNGYGARKLYGMFKRRGLADVTLEPCPLYATSYSAAYAAGRLDKAERVAIEAGIITPEEWRRLDDDFRRADAEGTFLQMVNMLLVAGRKP